MAKTKAPEAGNSGELKRLQEEIDRLILVRNTLNEQVLDKDKKISELTSECAKLNTSLTGAYARIKNLEAAVNKQEAGEDKVQEGYVTVASCPLPNGMKPLRVTVDGIYVPRTTDESGIVHEEMPISTAIALLSEGSGFARYLTGPVNSISGSVKKGNYFVPVTYHRYKKISRPDGGYEFVRTLAEVAPVKDAVADQGPAKTTKRA